jgi:hypothetical protein
MENIKKFFKPRPLYFIGSAVLVLWHYFYFVDGILKEITETIEVGMPLLVESINWGSYLAKKISFVGIWIVATIGVFVIFFLFEIFVIKKQGHKSSGDNQAVTMGSIDQGEIREKELSVKETLSKLGVVSLYIFSAMLVLLLPTGLEKIRISFIEGLFNYFTKDGLFIDYNNGLLFIASLLLLFIIWCGIMVIVGGIIRLLKNEEELIELTKDHLI